MAASKRERQAVLDAARAYYQSKFAPREEFVPGKTAIRYAGRVFDEEELLSLVDASLDMWLTAGRFAHQLEQDLAAWYGVGNASLVNSGSSANLLAVFALTSPLLEDRRLKPGDEIITTAAGFPTTVAPIVQAGAIPVFVDITTPTYNTAPELVEAAITDRTRAIFLAHTLGNPYPVAEIASLARRHRLFLIEDNCDAAGSLYKGKLTGTFGDLSTLSFYPAHQMTTGEGGAVLTNSDLLHRIVESLRDWGRDCWCLSGKDNTCGKRFGWQLGGLPEGYDHKYIYSHLGFNLKMTDMQAAVGCAQLRKLAGFVETRRRNWSFFRERLAPFAEELILPEPEFGADPSWFGFVMSVKSEASFSRAEIVNFLEHRKIATRMLFAGNVILQPAFRDVAHRVSGSLATTTRVMNDTFWIGVYPGLTEEMREYVAASFEEFFSAAKLKSSPTSSPTTPARAASAP